MSATPMTLEDALRFSGYTIEAYEAPGATITTEDGEIVVPPMIMSRLQWQHTHPPTLGSAFYLDKLPAFHPAYAPTQLSIILDHFRYRRLGYNTPDEFGLAVRRWGAVHLGAMSTLTRRYLSSAVRLPLDDIDMVRTGEETGTATGNTTTAGSGTTTSDGTGTATDTATTTDSSETSTKGRDAQSEFPQGQLAGNLDYASGAVDRVADSEISGTGSSNGTRNAEDHSTTVDTRTGNTTDTRNDTRNDTRTERGRSGRSVMELLQLQRETFQNNDAELIALMEPLYLGVFDRSEAETHGTSYQTGYGW